MSAFLNATSAGVTAKKIIDWIMKKDPNMRRNIQTALASGFTYERILDFFKKNQNYEKLKSKLSEQYNLDFNANPAVQAQTVRQQNLGQDAGTALQDFTKQAIKTAIPLTIGGLLSKTALPGINPQIGEETKTQKSQLPTPQQPPIKDLEENIPQITQPQQVKENPIEKHGFKQHVDRLMETQKDPKVIASILYSQYPKEMKKMQKKAGKNMEDLISDYVQETQAAPQEQKGVQSAVQKLDVSTEEAKRPIEKGSLVATPSGIGEIESISGDNVLVNKDGKLHQVKEEELEAAPEDLEPAVRHILDSIPESMKSTAMESSIHLSLPTGQDLMLVKFYDGKWAWYLDVPENTYSDIATGIYQPKTSGKTGIAEYKPGVIDSRGAGFQSEIVQNPKYEKGQRGKTWGYAATKYNALEQIQRIINKISKERYDEEGNLITPQKRKKQS